MQNETPQEKQKRIIRAGIAKEFATRRAQVMFTEKEMGALVEYQYQHARRSISDAVRSVVVKELAKAGLLKPEMPTLAKCGMD